MMQAGWQEANRLVEVRQAGSRQTGYREAVRR
jgi:hypothetical protein